MMTYDLVLILDQEIREFRQRMKNHSEIVVDAAVVNALRQCLKDAELDLQETTKKFENKA